MTDIRKKQVRMITWLFSATYMISYITRINFSSIISEMEAQTGFSRSLLAMALTVSAVTYGLGQIVSGILGDRVSPKKLVATGLAVTVGMNCLIPLCANPLQMAVIWSINGFAQSFMWPPIVRLMSALLDTEEYNRAVVRVSWGSSFGTILVYLLAPVLISLSGWKSVFRVCALCGGVMIPLWLLLCRDMPVSKPQASRKSTEGSTGLFSPLMLGIMAAIVLQGVLRDGVTTWMPSYISETYNLSNRIAILTGVIMPLFSIASFQAAAQLYHNRLTNPLLCAGAIFAFGTVSGLFLFLLSGSTPVCSVLFSALLTGAMHGVNLILICMVPPFFFRYGNVAAVSGMLNCCTYIGSALSSYGIALISENLGWRSTILIWVLLAAAGTAICFSGIQGWNRCFH